MPKRSDYVQDIPKFTSRYREEDTSYLLPENQPKPWWRNKACNKRRLLLFTTILLVCYATISNATSIKNFIDDNSTALAHWQSYGLISDETNRQWMKRQTDFWENRHDKMSSSSQVTNDMPTTTAEIVAYYDTHWNVDFQCPHEETIGSYTMCGLTSYLQSKHNCLVYASDPPNKLLLETSIQPLLHETCEIHVFDPTNTTNQYLPTTNNETGASIQLHSWGFSTTSSNNNSSTKFPLLSISDTMQQLEHQGRTIDLFVLNCGGCEWSFVPSLLREVMTVSQLLVQVHGKPRDEFFQALQQDNYVTYHKEPTTWDNTQGLAQSYSFLKLRKGFFSKPRRWG